MTPEVPKVSYLQVERKKKIIRDSSLKNPEYFIVVMESTMNSILDKAVEPTPWSAEIISKQIIKTKHSSLT